MGQGRDVGLGKEAGEDDGEGAAEFGEAGADDAAVCFDYGPDGCGDGTPWVVC